MKSLNNNQKKGLWLGIALAVAMGIYPPWVSGGTGGTPGDYAPIFNPPPPVRADVPMQVDFSRLLLQWAMIGLVVGGLLATGNESPASEPHQRSAGAKGMPESSSKSSPITFTQPAILSQAETAELRRLRFPEGDSIGQVLMESQEDPDYWDLIGDAIGVVGIPADGRVQLELRKDAHVSLGSLGQPEMSAIVSIDASGSEISDDDLMWIAALKELRELDLSNTGVTNGALPHLARVQSLEKLWLDGTAVTDEGLTVLKDLPKLRKVSFANTSVSDSTVISLKDQTKDCLFVLSNGKNA